MVSIHQEITAFDDLFQKKNDNVIYHGLLALVPTFWIQYERNDERKSK